VQPFIEKAEIRTLIPHAGSMCLLDRVLAWDDRSILCASETHRDSANPLRRDGRLAAVHAFEYGAQAVAVHGGLRARAAGGVAPPGYLAALRDGRLHTQPLDDFTSPLHVEAERLFSDSANSVYQCRVSAGETLLASGRITIIMQKPSATFDVREETRGPAQPIPNGQITLRRSIPSDHPSLRGHFPGQPIVPGVVILDEVISAMAQVRKSSPDLKGIESVKFLAPLMPEEIFAISFMASAEAQAHFQCQAAERVIAQGRVQLTSHDRAA
jgi:predicted hotdog family 3-hydroxylacyl-ACP dehydratase/3-hydroxymyristoyl/3-hydroxydecanoyl-(acyl carrier protein) dehydratase